jgi:multiple sugar transport system substrate-binding protein
MAATRRSFLRMAGLAAFTLAGPILAACGAPPSPTAKPAEAPKPAAPAEPTKPAATAAPIQAVGAGSVQATATAAAAPAPAKPATGGAPQTTIEFLHPWEGDHGGARAMVALAKRYEEIKPVKINQTIVAGAEYNRKQLAAFASGVVPDMTLTDAETLPVYADRDVLLSLDDYIKRDKITMKDYFDFTVAQTSWMGKVYAMTHHPDIRTIVYRNAPLMQEAGLDGSKGPESWDDLKAWGIKMTKRDGNRTTQFGWVPMWIQNTWAVQFPQANGQTFLDKDARKVTYDTPAVVEALDFVVKATDEINGGRDKVVEFDAGQPDKGQQNVYGNSGLAIAIGGNWYLDRIANVSKNEKALKSQVSMMPGGPSAKGKQFMFGGGTMDSVIKGAKQPDAAWDYTLWISQPEGQFIAQNVSYDVGGHREGAQDKRIVDNRLLRKEILPMFDKATDMGHFYTPAWLAMRDEVVRVQDAMLLKQMTAAAGAKELQTKLQAILDDYWSKKK